MTVYQSREVTVVRREVTIVRREGVRGATWWSSGGR